MSTSEERLKILNMIAEGKITAEEGARLLSALKQSKARQTSPKVYAAYGAAGDSSAPRFLRIRVTELSTERIRANVNLPLSLVNVGIRMGARFVPDIEDIDLQELIEGIEQGERGKILEVENPDEDEHIEIYLE